MRSEGGFRVKREVKLVFCETLSPKGPFLLHSTDLIFTPSSVLSRGGERESKESCL